MAYVADLHIHSRFSRATSPKLTIQNLAKWAKFKGVDLMGSGDFLHPLWQREIKQTLIERADGLLEYGGVKFVLSCEVSCIYTHNGKLRRVHILILLPSLKSMDQLSQVCQSRGLNISADGRPIFGMSAQQLCEMVWGVDIRAVIIPAHIWTPWFAIFGSKSGYDFLSECFGKYSDQIYAVETGLSSEPIMNWRVAELDSRSIVSFSDAHSLGNIGREVTIFKGNLSYDEMVDDLKKQNIVGTIEFFPEEGQYHYSGHRKCDIVWGPEEVKEKGKICPVCGQELTIGAVERVEELATRSVEELELYEEEGVIRTKKFPQRAGFRMLVQLEQIIAEALGVLTKTKKVQNEFDKMMTHLGNEIYILTKAPLEKIQAVAGPKIAEGIDRVRQGKLTIKPGFDNSYGVVKIWDED